MLSSYPADFRQFDTHPLSPFYIGDICPDCGESEYKKCDCDVINALSAQAEDAWQEWHEKTNRLKMLHEWLLEEDETYSRARLNGNKNVNQSEMDAIQPLIKKYETDTKRLYAAIGSLENKLEELQA